MLALPYGSPSRDVKHQSASGRRISSVEVVAVELTASGILDPAQQCTIEASHLLDPNQYPTQKQTAGGLATVDIQVTGPQRSRIHIVNTRYLNQPTISFVVQNCSAYPVSLCDIVFVIVFTRIPSLH
jgi:hypothetical protein